MHALLPALAVSVAVLLAPQASSGQPYGPPVVLTEAAPGSGLSFGFAVNMGGGGLVVAAPAHLIGGQPGGAVYRFDATGTPIQTFLNPSPGGGFAMFGHSTALVGGNVLVGAPGENANDGVAYLFDGTSGVGLLTVPAPNSNDVYFGWSVAALGGDLLVGAPQGDAGHGVAYALNGTTGAVLHTLHDPNAGFFDDFGYAVAALPGVAIVGAERVDGGASDAGAVYVFDATTGSVLHTLRPPTIEAGTFFGLAVGGSAGTIVVGAPGGDNIQPTRAGAAYLFDASSGTHLRTLLSPTGATDDFFGWSVTMTGSLVVVGAPKATTGAPNSGAAYVFDAATGALLQTLLPGTPIGNGGFGISVAALNDRLIVGSADARSIGPTVDPGVAQLYATDCGDGTITGVEVCDDGNFVSGDGCSPACGVEVCFTCAGEPSVCTPTPGCVPCGILGDRSTITLKHLGAPGGDDVVSFRGAITGTVVPLGGDDPSTTGARFEIGTDGAVVQAVIPPGLKGSGCGTLDGWRVRPGSFTYKNVSGALPPACTPGSAAGIRSAKLTDHYLAQGTFGFQLTIKDGTLPAVADAPLRGKVVIGQSTGAGHCGELNFARRSFKGTTGRFAP